ncbi:MAG: hypothetical protein MUO26_12550 [Methanotrichaceae archaeon]|nr:hypothetical protein [Methanotrichaceae archaeon]
MRIKKFRRKLCDHDGGDGRESRFITVPQAVWKYIWNEDAEYVDIVLGEDGRLTIAPVVEGE